MKSGNRKILHALLKEMEPVSAVRSHGPEIVLRLIAPTIDEMQRVPLSKRLDDLLVARQTLVEGIDVHLDQIGPLAQAEDFRKTARFAGHVILAMHGQFVNLYAQRAPISVPTAAKLLAQVTDEMIPSIVAVIECLRDVYEAANRHTNQEEAKALTAGLHSVSRVGQEIQTIAINAAIEDARAGPAGRGFAIISQETRGLSKTSETSLEALNALLGRDSAA
jgi:hypothetical protein